MDRIWQMKPINFALILLLAFSCMESNRTRLFSEGISESDSIRSIEQSIYESEINLLTEIESGIIEIPYGSSDTDYDENYSCDLEVESRTMMKYQITGNTLELIDDKGSYQFEKRSSESGHELNGIWSRSYTEGKVAIVLFLDFSNGHLRITKKCTLN